MPKNCVDGQYCSEEKCLNSGVCRKQDPDQRASEIERVLTLVRLRLERALKENLAYVPRSEACGHPHGFSVVQIPDWEARQLLELIRGTLATR